jgi:cellulose synthase/poly-beta-1,6-N-acetylglucosamine synthase-like glycosyltransferase
MISVIIASYKNIKNLEIIFFALKRQSFKNFEVIVAEDDNNSEMIDFLDIQRNIYKYKIKHVNQPGDIGFRKNVILNKAINIAEGDIIVFIDGDCIPHKHLLKIYAKNSGPNKILFGRRVMLSKKNSDKVLETKNFRYLKFFYLLYYKSEKLRYSLYLPFFKIKKAAGIWGCNWSCMKKQIIEVNGFDEDFDKACFGEDTDIEWRLVANGNKLFSVRYSAIVYHLFHEKNYSRTESNESRRLMLEKKKQNIIFCKNGLKKIIDIG